MSRRGAFASFVTLAIVALPSLASAHAFGQQYTLPLPFQYYALGASMALLVSFVFLAFYSAPSQPQSVAVSIGKMHQIPYWRAIKSFLRLIGIVGFAGTIVCAFYGAADFTLNPVPELFWSILLLGFAYLSVFIADLWRFVSPFETLCRILLPNRDEPLIKYPESFGYIPALIMYFILIWLELLSGGLGALPTAVGTTLLAYAAICIIGSSIFGIDSWFTYADFFTVFFGLIGRFAPVRLEGGYVRVHPPAERLVIEQTGRLSLLIFILFMLSSTAFDGLEETQIWWNTFYHSAFQMQIYPMERNFIFFLSPFLFLALYALAIWLMHFLTRTKLLITTLLARFAFSLIPIAIAYNFAHYFTLLVNSVQTLVIMASDPLNKGWNIFGTAQRGVNIGLIGAKEVWIAQFSSIVLGHIIATYVAHEIAVRVFPTRAQVIVGQLPMLLLMVFYTVFGLWILSQGYQTGA